MAKGLRIQVNPAGIDECLREPAVKNLCLEAANAAADVTRTLVWSQDVKNVLTQLTDDGAAVGLDSSFWHWQEFGNINLAPRAPLRNGADAAGIELR